jgi:hypothetical protein
VGPYPDNALARDVFQVNLQCAALRSMINPATSSPYKVGSAKLVYGNPRGRKATEFVVPMIPQQRLEELIGDLYGYIGVVRQKMADPNTPRALLNAAWSFPGQRERFHHAHAYTPQSISSLYTHTRINEYTPSFLTLTPSTIHF